ncbi:MAG: hypothetical protein HY554_10105, partial [Elusimicrobia bacterium]|nr:hypothetical protein [Elusimicrobiota bacterium]
MTSRLARPWCLLFLAAASLCLLSWPIVPGDADLWQHLTAGRFIALRRAVPVDSFFSFLSPAREFHDYSWLFQLVAFLAHETAGYHGLIVLRTAVFALLGWLILRIVKPERSGAFGAAVFTCALLVLVWRYRVVRPHVFTYLFIALALYLAQEAPRRACLLIPLAVVWANTHGIAYPVLGLVCAAYLAERVYESRGGRAPPAARPAPWPLLLAPLALLATPLGADLLVLPFASMARVRFLAEIQPFDFRDLASFSIRRGALNPFGAFALFAFLAAAAAASSAWRRKGRLSHWILFLGGLGLLFKGVRMMNECVLLGLPLLASLEPLGGRCAKDDPARPARAFAQAALAAAALMTLVDWFSTRPRYPFSRLSLPEGIGAFLERVDTGGKVMNFANTGGYLAWRVWPRYRIFMDMNFPNLFTADDLYRARAVYTTEEGLRNALEEYDPDYVSAPHAPGALHRMLARRPDYARVFFDDTDVLYASRRLQPEVAARFALPVSPAEGEADTLDPSHPANRAAAGKALPDYLERMLAIDPEGRATNTLASQLRLARGDPAGALIHSAALRRVHPQEPAGFLLHGDALAGLGRLREAVAEYELALARTDETSRAPVHHRLGTAHQRLREPRKAYAHFLRSLDPDAPEIPRRELYRLGLLALQAGREKDSRLYMRRLSTHRTPRSVDW